MSTAIIQRVINEANLMLEQGLTIREVAKHFHVSKSTVHKDLGERLPLIDRELSKKIIKILQYHLTVRHLRGGESTKKKYFKIKESSTKKIEDMV